MTTEDELQDIHEDIELLRRGLNNLHDEVTKLNNKINKLIKEMVDYRHDRSSE